MIKNINIKIIKIISICFIIFYIFNISFVQATTIGTVVGKKDVGLNSGLLGWWTMDGKDISNGTVLDMSGNGRTGNLMSISTSTFYTAGKIGQGFNFDGVDDFVNLSSPSSFNVNKPVTVSMWVKSTNDSAGSIYGVGDKDATHERTGFSVGNGATGTLTNELITVSRSFEPDDTTYIVGYTTANRNELFNGKWHLVTIVWDSTVKIYLDGQSKTVTLGVGTNNGTYGGHAGVDAVSVGSTMYNGTLPYNPFVGSLDDVRIYNRALSDSEIQQLYNMGSATKITTPVGKKSTGLNSGLVVHWTMDGKDTPWTSATAATTIDKSGSGYTGTLTNMNRSSSPTLGKLGQALNFDGVDDYVITSSNLITLGDFTVCSWFKPGSGSGYDRIVDASFLTGFWIGRNNGSSEWGGGIRFNDGNPIFLGVTLTNGVWHHLCMSRSGTVQTVIADGGLQSTTGTVTNTNTASSLVRIGASEYVGTDYYDGVIDEVRIYNRALSASEIQQLYNTGSATKITTPVSKKDTGLNSGLLGWWTMDGKDTLWTSATAATTIDKSGNGRTGTLTNMNRNSSTAIGKIGQGLYFDGVDDYVSVPDHSSFNTAGNFTASVWFNAPNVNQTSPLIGRRLGVPPYTQWNFIINGDDCLNGQLGKKICVFLLESYPSTYRSFVTTNEIVDGKWHHAVVVSNRTAGTLKIYVDGNEVPVTTWLSAGSYPNPDVAQPLTIGNVNSPLYFSGTIDDVRYYNRALSASEVQQLYNMGR